MWYDSIEERKKGEKQKKIKSYVIKNMIKKIR